MKLSSTPLFVSALFAGLLVACSPSAEDEARMKEKMFIETGESDIMLANIDDCKKLEKELVAFGEAHSEKIKSLDTWWDGLSKGKRQKLNEAHSAEWDKQTLAMMKTIQCKDALKTGMRAGH